MNLTRCLTPDDGEPLYRQIAAHIAYAIATGRLQPGAVLPSLRRAQGAWRVHLHTVRRAYLELQRRGLVRIRKGEPTVVLAASDSEPGSLRESVVAFLAEAGRRHGATPASVAAEIRRIVDDRPRVPVAECSHTLARSIGDQLTRAWHISPRPILLAEARPVEDPVVSTYFHRGDLVTPAHGTGPAVVYVRLRLSGRVLGAMAAKLLRGPARRVAICETDSGFATRLAAELCAGLPAGVAVRVHTPVDIARFVNGSERDALKLVSPRHWDRLPEDRRTRPDVMLLDYDVDPVDLAELGRRLGWRRAERPRDL